MTRHHQNALLLSFPVWLGLLLSGCQSGNQNETKNNSGEDSKDLIKKNETPKVETNAKFLERTADTGIAFTYRSGHEYNNFAILESLGGGVGLIDYDQDGWLDVFLPGGGYYSGKQILGHPNGFYRNLGEWNFVESTIPAGVKQARYYSHGGAVADYDADGFPDILVTGYGGLCLFHNNGDGTFSEDTKSHGLTDTLWSSSAAWGDYNEDGILDVYVAHYVNWSFENDPQCPAPDGKAREVCSPRQFDPLPDILYFGNGDGTFRDGSEYAGLKKEGKGLGVVSADLDLDGLLDVYVANDTVPNLVYKNVGEGKFSEEGDSSSANVSNTGTPDGSMGIDVGDYNLDGLPDIWVANFEHESFALYRNDDQFRFLHVSHSTGVTAIGGLFVGWGTVFLDFDQDGDEDIVVSNGHVIRYPVNAPLRQTPLLFDNQQGKRLINVAPGAGEFFASPHMGRGLAMGDLDNDGDTDLVVCHNDEPIALLENQSKSLGHWIGLELIGNPSSRLPIGAMVKIECAGMPDQTRQLKGGSSYASTHDTRILFGLGKAERPEEIEIVWPSGNKQTLKDLEPNQYHLVREPLSDE